MADLGSGEGSAEHGPGPDGGERSSPGWPRRWQPWQVVAAAVVVAALAVAGTLVATRRSSTKQRVATGPTATSAPAATTTRSTTATASTTTTPGTTTTTPSSAASDLAPFFAAAAHEDAKLKVAATLVNRGIGKTAVTFDQATVDAVHGLDPKAVSATIPNGIEPGLKRAVLLVYSDIMSRRMAMSRVGNVGTYPMSDYGDLLTCLHNGSLAAARYPGDLAAARELAAQSPPVVSVPADSRSAEDLAVRLNEIDLQNSGCGSCGGYTPTELVPVTLYSQPTYYPRGHVNVDGTIGANGGVGFTARYNAATGWTVQLIAC